jgi:chitinase domain-containing protein 1
MAANIGRQLIEFAKKYEMDGYVLEMWNAFAVQQRDQVIHLIAKIYALFKKAGLQLMLVVPPPIHHGGRLGLLTRSDIERLSPYVHGFSVMTYDYSTVQRPGPNSPIDWVRECIKILAPKASSPIRKKLLMGLNMYGFDYTPTGGGPITGSRWVF